MYWGRRWRRKHCVGKFISSFIMELTNPKEFSFSNLTHFFLWLFLFAIVEKKGKNKSRKINRHKYKSLRKIQVNSGMQISVISDRYKNKKKIIQFVISNFSLYSLELLWYIFSMWGRSARAHFLCITCMFTKIYIGFIRLASFLGNDIQWKKAHSVVVMSEKEKETER